MQRTIRFKMTVIVQEMIGLMERPRRIKNKRPGTKHRVVTSIDTVPARNHRGGRREAGLSASHGYKVLVS